MASYSKTVEAGAGLDKNEQYLIHFYMFPIKSNQCWRVYLFQLFPKELNSCDSQKKVLIPPSQ